MADAGHLIDRVAFDEPTGGVDAFGGRSVAWTERHIAQARFMYAGGDEGVQSGREDGRKRYKLKIRSCIAARAITPSYRMRDVRRSTEWNIVEVDPIADRAMVWLTVEGPVVR